MTLLQIEEKLNRLEREVAHLRTERGKTGKWWIDQAGQFSGDPVYQEIVRLGRKYRQSLRPKRKRGGK